MSLLSICPYESLKEKINYLDCFQHWSMKFKSRLPWIAREWERDFVQLRYLELLRRNGVKEITFILFSKSAWSSSEKKKPDTRVLKRSPKSCLTIVVFLFVSLVLLRAISEHSSWCFFWGASKEQCTPSSGLVQNCSSARKAFEQSAANDNQQTDFHISPSAWGMLKGLPWIPEESPHST